MRNFNHNIFDWLPIIGLINWYVQRKGAHQTVGDLSNTGCFLGFMFANWHAAWIIFGFVYLQL